MAGFAKAARDKIAVDDKNTTFLTFQLLEFEISATSSVALPLPRNSVANITLPFQHGPETETEFLGYSAPISFLSDSSFVRSDYFADTHGHHGNFSRSVAKMSRISGRAC